MERDRALTGCLTIPSDEVKKAVVNCLFYVDCNEFDKDEIKEIYMDRDKDKPIQISRHITDQTE